METLSIPGPAISKPPDQGTRLHGIDALRAIAMILGMLLHATIAYKVRPLPNWPHDSDFNHWSFDFLYHAVHSFRMPLFFLIAGYFSRLLFHKLGEQAFISHRFKRIVVPFFFSLIFILPFTLLPFSIYRYSIIYSGQWNIIFKESFRHLIHWNGMAHLWFLYYLVIYYGATIAFFRVKKILFPEQLPAKVTSLINYFHPGRYVGIALFVLFTWFALLLSPQLYLAVDTGLLPSLSYLFFYGIFFLMGWLINKKPVIFSWIARQFPLFISLGGGLCILLFFVEFYEYANSGWQNSCIKLVVATQIVTLVYGVIGFFLRFCHSQKTSWKYISDASYWMYLIHLGIIAGLQIFFLNSSIPGIIRFLLVLIVPIIITLVTYQYFVRYTILGYFLHGTRKRVTGITP